LRNLTNVTVACALFALVSGTAGAQMPSVASLDAHARASGNQKTLATHVGESIFSKPWPVQVVGISANRIGGHTVLGMRLSGVKFHAPITRGEYVDEIVSLVERAFAAAPSAEETDLWTIVPIPYRKGEIVTGALAQPTSRPVFSVSVRKGESASHLGARIRAGNGVFWDQEWSRMAFKHGA